MAYALFTHLEFSQVKAVIIAEAMRVCSIRCGIVV
jgi:hypothetical protein